MKDVMAMFPNASQSFREANPQSDIAGYHPDAVATPLRRGKGMNKTETEFSLILEAQKRKGEILRYVYEGITLRWADMRYTPDFVVFGNQLVGNDPLPFISLIEVKGAHIWDRDIVRFKGARALWPEFSFEMHQKTKEGWKQCF